VNSCRVFPSKCPSVAPAETSNIQSRQFGPLEDNQLGGYRLDPKNRGENFSCGFFHSDFFVGGRGVSRYTATPFIFSLSPGHSDTTRFRLWTPIATGNHLHRTKRKKKIQKLLKGLAPLMFFIRVQVFQDPLRGELPSVQFFMNDGPNPLT
jgi:hypothetical protein